MKHINDYDIDFVVLWVDSNDPEWQRQKRQFTVPQEMPIGADDANDESRYRSDDEMLRFWFRSVEKNAPWVHKIYFVSAGQVPAWLDGNNPKIEIVCHKDFIPSQYLPTFNSQPIQFNLHRISLLSEHFVLFDDDMFLLNYHSPEYFFKDGDPVLATYLGFINVGYSNWHRMMWNATAVINEHFDIHKSIWKYRSKWFSIKNLGMNYAAYNLLCFLANKVMPVNYYGHMPYPHLKSTIEEVWSVQARVLHNTCMHKFRSDAQLNHYLFCAWNQLNGRFYPAPVDPPGKWYSLSPDNIDSICDTIRKKIYPAICINDSSNNTEPEIASKKIISAFYDVFPEKSSFEK